MSNARKDTLAQLVKMRRDIQTMINHLSGDPEHREYLRRLETDEPTSIRTNRYDGPSDPEEVAKLHGLTLEPEPGHIPQHFQRRFGHLLPSVPSEVAPD